MNQTTESAETYAMVTDLEKLWQKAKGLYEAGNRNPEEFFEGDEREILKRWGLGVMDVYDYVEDFVGRGEPGLGDFLLITAERVFYFLDEMGGRVSGDQVNADHLPPKTEAVGGIEWLPRILVKAKGKLRGELPPEIMYGCGGDRRFLREHGIHPAEFLRKVRSVGSDDEVVEWVAARAGRSS